MKTKRFRKWCAIFIPTLVIIFFFAGFLFAPNDPMKSNLLERYADPSAEYPFGTDALGRCILSRILYGGWTTLGIVLGGSLIVFLLGTVIGMVTSRAVMKENALIDGLINAVTAIPPIAYLIVFIGAWGSGAKTTLVALTVSYILRYIKLVRTRTDMEMGKAYVMCAIASGASKLRIMLIHIFPNLIAEMIRFLCLSCADMILAITGFSFIGLGLGDNVVDWGSMILDANVDVSMVDQAGGNMEGKETRFGIAASSTWATFTTAASNGSVNSMHDSYTPLGGMVTMLLMQLGEVIFGGVGCGLYGMLAFAILTVFIAGLMVGRTPEFLGKKIEPYEMKWSVLVCLATPIAILVGSGIAAVWPGIESSLNNVGAHGFSELLYTFSSCGGNNGSAFAGFNGNTMFLNLLLGFVMLFARFLPIIGTLAISGNLAEKKKIATTAGTLSTTSTMFVFLLIFIVLLVGALSFFPALALGPIAEFFQSIV